MTYLCSPLLLQEHYRFYIFIIFYKITVIWNTGSSNVLFQEGDTALHVAAAWGELEVIKILVENGALLHIPNHIGQLPLHVAISRRHSNVALYLLNSGTDFDLHDSVS